MKFNLVITPAIKPQLRHKIENVLKKAGYDIIGSGQFTDDSKCNISFACDDIGSTEILDVKPTEKVENE